MIALVRRSDAVVAALHAHLRLLRALLVAARNHPFSHRTQSSTLLLFRSNEQVALLLAACDGVFNTANDCLDCSDVVIAAAAAEAQRAHPAPALSAEVPDDRIQLKRMNGLIVWGDITYDTA